MSTAHSSLSSDRPSPRTSSSRRALPSAPPSVRSGDAPCPWRSRSTPPQRCRAHPCPLWLPNPSTWRLSPPRRHPLHPPRSHRRCRVPPLRRPYPLRRPHQRCPLTPNSWQSPRRTRRPPPHRCLIPRPPPPRPRRRCRVPFPPGRDFPAPTAPGPPVPRTPPDC